MIDTFSLYHPFINFFYFCVVLLFSMFNQHPVFLGISYAGAFSYAVLLNGWKKTAKQSFLFTLPCLTIIALMNPLFNHYGVTMLYYVESSGNWITLESLVYGIVLGAVMFVVIQWFSCYNKIMTTDKFIYLFIWKTDPCTFTYFINGFAICSEVFGATQIYPKWTKSHGKRHFRRKAF